MRARPVAVHRRPQIERHLQPLAGVEARAAHLGEVPVRPEIARPHLGVGLEPAAGQHHRFRPQIAQPAAMAHPHAFDAAVAGQQRHRRGLVQHRDAVARGAGVQRLDQFLAAAPDVAGEPAPEFELAVDAERLAAEAELKAHALLAHPQPGLKAAADQDFGQVGVAAILGHPSHVVEILLLGVGAEIDVAQLGLVHVGDQPRQILAAVVDDAKGAAGKGGVAAALILGGDFEHQHRGPVLARRQRRAAGGVAGPDHDHIPNFTVKDLVGCDRHGMPLPSTLR